MIIGLIIIMSQSERAKHTILHIYRNIHIVFSAITKSILPYRETIVFNPTQQFTVNPQWKFVFKFFFFFFGFHPEITNNKRRNKFVFKILHLIYDIFALTYIIRP